MDPIKIAFITALTSSAVAWVCFIATYRANKRLLKITKEAL